MSKRELPDWMAIRAARRQQEQARSELQTQRKLAAAKAIEAGSANFVKGLFKELSFAIAGCASLHMHGLITVKEDDQEECWSVSVSTMPPVNRHASIDLYYATGASGVRCIPSTGAAFALEFCADAAGTVFVASTAKILPSALKSLTAEQAARSIIEPLLDAVEL